MKEEEESGLEERRAREQLGEGVEVGIHSFETSAGSSENWHIVLSSISFLTFNLTTSHIFIVFRWVRLIWCGEQTTLGIRSVVLHFTNV